MRYIAAFLWIVFLVLLMTFPIWWWFGADCTFIKQYWFLGHVPGRCLYL